MTKPFRVSFDGYERGELFYADETVVYARDEAEARLCFSELYPSSPPWGAVYKIAGVEEL